MVIVQVYVSPENRPLNQSQGEKLDDYYGGVPLGMSIDFIKYEALLPGRWVTIVDQSKKPIILSEISSWRI